MLQLDADHNMCQIDTAISPALSRFTRSSPIALPVADVAKRSGGASPVGDYVEDGRFCPGWAWGCQEWHSTSAMSKGSGT